MQALLHSQPKLAERQQRRKSMISLTPLIDVVFILLVFFMLASSFLGWRSITLQTVKSSSETMSTELEQEPWLVSVSDSEVRLNGRPLSVEQLIMQLTQGMQAGGNIVHIKPLGDTPLQAVIQLLDKLNSANIERIKLVPDAAWQLEKQ